MLVAAWFLCLAGNGSSRADEMDVFRFSGDSGIVYTVTADGLSHIAVGDRTVATGGWHAFNAGPGWFRRGTTDADKAGAEPLALNPHDNRGTGQHVRDKSLTIAMTLRVSPDTDWKHLLQPYKDQFLATFGDKTYKTDFRSVGVAHVNRNREAISPANPYGFHGGFRRLDLADEVEKLCDMLIPALQRMNGIGLIFWGQGGQEPRGQMYRADFDILPPEVEANWPRLIERFNQAGLAIGVTTRPRHIHLRQDWENDMTLDINADDPRHLEMLWGRFKNMIDRGVTLFYLDSFGSQAMDVTIMRYLRQRMGPDIQTFAEHACDVMAVYSAFYSETDFYAKGSRDWATEDQWRPRTGLRFLEIVNWLVGPTPCISRGYDIHGEIPEGFEPSASFFFRHGMAPMISDHRLPDLADSIREIQDTYVTEEGERHP